MQKFNLLVSTIRNRGSLTMGEACLKLNVGPWQIRRYGEAILDTCGDIRFDKEHFWTVIEEATDPRQKTLNIHTERDTHT